MWGLTGGTRKYERMTSDSEWFRESDGGVLGVEYEQPFDFDFDQVVVGDDKECGSEAGVKDQDREEYVEYGMYASPSVINMRERDLLVEATYSEIKSKMGYQEFSNDESVIEAVDLKEGFTHNQHVSTEIDGEKMSTSTMKMSNGIDFKNGIEIEERKLRVEIDEESFDETEVSLTSILREDAVLDRDDSNLIDI